ncbi:recombination protein NinB [Metapseudomonas furukawaii]|uniref:recombination protein NinB n=1 Tax=Metapseudomonas furukawaii TaxID=1149133 RepID=UPI00227A23D0|nr:recombination protein NinB [Pseudomonas furukawaii]WAG76989.1 recombination protein NinB [Pseudomonas furukawaii]
MADLQLRTESDRQRLLGFISGLDLSKPRKVAISEVRSKRSDAQNRLLWLWNGEIQKHLRETFGQIASAEEWHEILVSRLWPSEVHPVQLPDGTRYRVGRAKTRTFNIQQMTTYLELLDAYCAEHLQLLLPHPEDLMMAIYGERRGRAA